MALPIRDGLGASASLSPLHVGEFKDRKGWVPGPQPWCCQTPRFPSVPHLPPATTPLHRSSGVQHNSSHTQFHLGLGCPVTLMGKLLGYLMTADIGKVGAP